MKIYAYGIIDSNVKISDSISGLEEICVYNIPYRDIGIVVSKLSEQIQNITKDRILKHEEVVERLMEDFTVLPVKFLTVFNKEEDVFLMMKEYHRDFRENLDRLRNKKEFGVKVIWPGDIKRNRIVDAYKKSNANAVIQDNLPPHQKLWCGGEPLKNFVKERFEKYKIDKEFEEEADKYIALIDNFLSRWACEKKLEKLKSENLLLNAFYLVEKEKEEDFKEAFKRAKGICICGDLKYLFSGPWPPYNFIVLTKNADMFNRKPVDQSSVGESVV